VWSPAYGDLEHRLARFDEAAWNELLTEKAIDAVRANPDYVRHTVVRNARGYFELSPTLNDFPEVSDGRHMGFRRATLPLYWVVTTLGLVGAWRRRGDPRIRVLALLAAQYVVLSLVLVAPPRLRAPLDLLCCIGFGLLLSELAAWWSRRERPPAL